MLIEANFLIYAFSLVSVGFTVGITYSKLDKRLSLLSQSLENFKADYYKQLTKTNRESKKC